MQTGTEDRIATGAPSVVMEERKEPRFMKFEKPGDNVMGRLLVIEQVEVGETRKPATRFVVEEGVLRAGYFKADGELVAFLGTYGIDSKLRPSDVQHYISIRYTGSDATVTRNGNAMKVFDVKVSNCVIEDDPVAF